MFSLMPTLECASEQCELITLILCVYLSVCPIKTSICLFDILIVKRNWSCSHSFYACLVRYSIFALVLFFSVSVSVCLSVCLFLCLLVSVFVSLSLSLSLSLSFCLSVFLSLCHSVSESPCRRVSLSQSLSVPLSAFFFSVSLLQCWYLYISLIYYLL